MKSDKFTSLQLYKFENEIGGVELESETTVAHSSSLLKASSSSTEDYRYNSFHCTQQNSMTLPKR